MSEPEQTVTFWGALARSESHTLEVIWTGLRHLSEIVKKLEKDRLEQQPKSEGIMIMSFNSDDGSGDKMLLNYFFWYSCSADAFLDLFVKAFSVTEDLNPDFAPMRKFRDKVGAHSSHVQPRRDNRETQAASLRQFVTWDCGRYSVGREVTYDLQSGESSPSDWGWELTDTHEKLKALVKRNLKSTTT